jgi:hypothetical protein
VSVFIAHKMGTGTLKSTAANAIPKGEARKRRVIRPQLRCGVFNQSSVYIATFSGKLSTLMTNSEEQIRIEPPPKPEQAERSGATPAALRPPQEVGGREGPEPTRFGDWELRGRCIDF